TPASQKLRGHSRRSPPPRAHEQVLAEFGRSSWAEFRRSSWAEFRRSSSREHTEDRPSRPRETVGGVWTDIFFSTIHYRIWCLYSNRKAAPDSPAATWMEWHARGLDPTQVDQGIS